MALERSPQSRAEIAALPPIGTTECEQVLRESGGRLAPESLVHVIREAAETRNTGLIELCGRYLTGSGGPGWPGSAKTAADRVIAGVARRFGFHEDPVVLELFWAASLDAMWDGILAGWAQKPFWEVSFRHTLWAKCIDVGRPLYNRWERESKSDISLETIPELAGPDALDGLVGRLGEEVVLAAIRRLPSKEAQAGLLHWVEGRPIDSADSGSVSNIMGLSARYVHTLLNKARQRLVQDPDIRSLLGNV